MGFEKPRVFAGRLVGLLVVFLCLAVAAEAKQTWTVDSGDLDLKDLTALVATATGRTILYGAEFHGAVHFEAAKRNLTADDLWRLYLSALAKTGWGVVLHGQVARVVSRQELASQDGPVVLGPSVTKPVDESLVTAVFELNNTDPMQIASQITPLVGKEGQVVPLPAQGRLLVVATAANIERVRLTLKKLDAPGQRDETQVVRLKRANATAVAEMLARIFATSFYEGGRFQPRQTAGGLTAIPEPRSNAVVLEGDRRDVATAGKLAERVDAAEDPVVLIRNIENADASNLTGILRDLLRAKTP
jgi:type II secretory pathway component GspD/PulD (secretin)